uniref:C2H2-type domain-containing protein n=1 Tax=Mola mola TaxID=94237 RepID=A0A3Q3W1K6_MOLML
MALQTVFSVGIFPVGVSLTEDGPSLSDAPGNTLPAPQLVMLANVAAVTATEGSGGDGSAADEKEMMELKTVGCSYSDSEDESIIRYSFDNQNRREFCVIEYPDSPGPAVNATVTGPRQDNKEDKAEDLSQSIKPHPLASAKTPEQEKLKSPDPSAESSKKKKPFHCKPCHFQAENEQQFVEHLRTHRISKMLVVNQVEGQSRAKAQDPETKSAELGSGRDATVTPGDVKGVIRCERCGYNTNRYDHYIAHLKHHSKEGEDHRVFKCTLCPYMTVSQYHWRKHLRNHFPSKLHTCSQCSYFSDRKSNYIQHIRTHTGVRPFQCLYCDYSSSQKTHLTRHMRIHSGERPFKCESCNYLSANQHEVTRHARQVHNGPKPLACPYCEYKTADRSNFKKHVELHLNPRQFLCPLCKYAASKKCNLQYHIKSRHAGCNVTLDISKVKLRVRKTGPDGAEENSRASKLKNSPNTQEDSDMENGDEDQGIDSSPINLSIRKSNRPSVAQLLKSEAPDKVQKKATVTSEKENPPKVKEQEKKVTTRQRKMEKINETLLEKEEHTEKTTASENTDGKAKRRVKRLPAGKAAVQDPPGETEPERDRVPKSDQKLQEEREVSPEKEKKNQKNDIRKYNKNHPKRSGSKKSRKIPDNTEDTQKKPNSLEKVQKEKVVKKKAAKRKAAEALDLTTKSSSETPSKARRRRATAAEKLRSNPKATGLEQAGDSVKDKLLSVSPSTDTPGGLTQLDNTIETTNFEPHLTKNSPAKNSVSIDPVCTTVPKDLAGKPTKLMGPAVPELTVDKPTNPTSLAVPPEKMEFSSPREDTPPPAKDCLTPVFVKPISQPSLVLPGQRSKPADPEDDEGIHSSHEGVSDISDSASEGSDDSGLNSNGTRSGKMTNDPETPTEEIPTPTELKSHMCIFCDRTFPLEVEYRRHLNRHLVNVYYMDNPGQNKAGAHG